MSTTIERTAAIFGSLVTIVCFGALLGAWFQDCRTERMCASRGGHIVDNWMGFRGVTVCVVTPPEEAKR